MLFKAADNQSFFIYIFFSHTEHLLHVGEDGSLGPAVATVQYCAHIVQAHGILCLGTVRPKVEWDRNISFQDGLLT